MLLPLRISEAQKDTIVPAHCLLPPGHKAGYVSYTQTARRYLYSSDSSVRPQDYFLIAEAQKDTVVAAHCPLPPGHKARYVSYTKRTSNCTALSSLRSVLPEGYSLIAEDYF